MPKKYLHKRANSFVYAFKGIVTLFRTQPNAQIHLLATAAVLVCGFYFGLERWEWVAVTISISLVWLTEALNTAAEFIVDLVSPEYHPLAGKAKDVAAGAVLIASIFAVIVGGNIFLPKLLALAEAHF